MQYYLHTIFIIIKFLGESLIPRKKKINAMGFYLRDITLLPEGTSTTKSTTAKFFFS